MYNKDHPFVDYEYQIPFVGAPSYRKRSKEEKERIMIEIKDLIDRKRLEEFQNMRRAMENTPHWLKFLIGITSTILAFTGSALIIWAIYQGHYWIASLLIVLLIVIFIRGMKHK